LSHVLDIEGITEKLFLLEHIVEGSEAYCAKRLVGSDLDQGHEEYENYWGWVKAIACSSLIECAVKFRILQDTIRGEQDIIEFDKLDSKCCENKIIGEIIEGKFKLSLREACNKIIHARNVTPFWSATTFENTEYKYWSGKVELRGTKGKVNWSLILDIAVWSEAMQLFIDEFSTTDSAIYIGQDWY
jgi:hypothetical protein